MKKTLLVMLLAVMVATPCFGQEIEPDGLFSIEGTRWRVCQIFFQTNLRPIISLQCKEDLAFYSGSVYLCTSSGTCQIIPFLDYIDTPIVGVAWEVHAECSSFYSFCLAGYQVAIMQPFGLGIHSIVSLAFGSGSRLAVCGIGIVFKVEDNWTPPGVEPLTE